MAPQSRHFDSSLISGAGSWADVALARYRPKMPEPPSLPETARQQLSPEPTVTKESLEVAVAPKADPEAGRWQPSPPTTTPQPEPWAEPETEEKKLACQLTSRPRTYDFSVKGMGLDAWETPHAVGSAPHKSVRKPWLCAAPMEENTEVAIDARTC
jgi:hypothetical protein